MRKEDSKELPVSGMWDVLVVGAGPAGLSAAKKTASEGLRTLVLEQKVEIGVPVRCAEYVPLRVAMEFPKEIWAQRTEEMWTFVEGNLVAKNRWPGVILQREMAERFLAMEAVDEGANIITCCRVLGVKRQGVVFQRKGKIKEVRAKFIVGADGPLSTCARALGRKRSPMLHCLQVRVPLKEKIDRTEVHFKRELKGGYAWLFPRGEKANVGLGVCRPQASRLRQYLEAFLDEMAERGLIQKRPPFALTGGLVPVGGPISRTVEEWMLLVGDAAGQTDPVTGGGIPNALLCGKIAGEAMVEAIKRGDPTKAMMYEEMWRDTLGKSLGRSARHRKIMEQDWEKMPLERVIRSHWIGFKEYFKG